MRNIFKFYRQKLAVNNSYTSLYVKFFIKSVNFDLKKKVPNMRYKDFFIWDGIHNRKLKKIKNRLLIYAFII